MKTWFEALSYRILRWYYIRDLRKVRNILSDIKTHLLDPEVGRDIVQAERHAMRALFDLTRERIEERKPTP